MRYQISGKNITVTEGISSQITRKLSKMDKYFHPDDDVLARVVVRVYKALAVDKLVGQMRKLKTQLKRRYEHEGIGKSIVFESIKDEEDKEMEATPVRTKNITLKPITMEDAVIEMESIGHDFYLYLDTDDEKVSVVYKRQEGGYGLLQADNKIEVK